MAASYPTSVKSFSTKASNDVVEAAHPNDLQDEVTALESALLTGGLAHNVFPSTSGARDLGTSALLWRVGYLSDALVLGAASTAGIRLEVNAGICDVREGDDSAAAQLRALDLLATSDIYQVAWTDYSATSVYAGWSAFTLQKVFYKKVGKLVYVAFQIEGTSNDTMATFTLPVARVTAAGFSHTFALAGDIQDNGAAVTTNAYGSLASGASTVTTARSAAGTAWTAAGVKRIAGTFVYEAAS